MNNAIIRKKLVESGRKLEVHLEWYKRNKIRIIVIITIILFIMHNIVYYAQYFKGVCDLAIALGFAESDIEVIIPEAWHYVNKEL